MKTVRYIEAYCGNIIWAPVRITQYPFPHITAIYRDATRCNFFTAIYYYLYLCFYIRFPYKIRIHKKKLNEWFEKNS